MRNRRPSPEHQEAVSRRLAQLSAELATARPTADEASWTSGEEPAWAGRRTRVRPVTGAELGGGPDALPDTVPAEWEEPRGDPPGVPVPGRHAARRASRLVEAAVPATLRGRVALGPLQVTVVALAVAVGLGGTCWWVVRADSAPVVAPAVGAASQGLVDVPSSGASVSGPPATSWPAPAA